MMSKEALKNMCNHCEKLSIRDGFIGCPYRCISNDYCEDFETIKKDLEILEIIKKWSFIKENYKEGFGIYDQFICNIHTVGMEEDFLKVEEWLEDENNK